MTKRRRRGTAVFTLTDFYTYAQPLDHKLRFCAWDSCRSSMSGAKPDSNCPPPSSPRSSPTWTDCDTATSLVTS